MPKHILDILVSDYLTYILNWLLHKIYLSIFQNHLKREFEAIKNQWDPPHFIFDKNTACSCYLRTGISIHSSKNQPNLNIAATDSFISLQLHLEP